MDLTTPLSELGATFRINARRLERLGLKTIEDLLWHIPTRYENYTIVSKIASVQRGEIVTIKGRVEEIKNFITKNRKKIQVATIKDNSGTINAIWFNQMYILRVIRKGDIVSLAGKIDYFQARLAIYPSEYEILSSIDSRTIHTGRLVPIYPETRGLSSKWIRNRIKEIVFSNKKEIIEYIPDSILTYHDLMDINEAIEQIHFPKNLEKAKMAKRRLAFEEFFLTHLAALIRRSQWMNKKVVHQLLLLPYRGMVNAFIKNLPFELTDAQKIALREILSDLTGAKPMNRLLEGEVGSGKTVVATIAMYVVFLNGFQSVLMAPTEILANQHYKTISELLANYGVRVELITGATRSKRKDKKIEDADILVGTHALINRSLRFDKIGLVVIDEQQRFGVEQRALLREKAVNPHVLTMTATPIPRTVFLTLYGDLDLSYLNELPKERKLVKTWLVPQEKREAGYEWIKKQIKENGDQVFIICPFIEESETLTSVKAAKKEFERLKADIFPEFRVGLLHGRLKAKEKNEVIEKFKNREIDILVSTPVVEVGIDIPNATIILIEAAERFGLAQLHQLRGRVGRGNKQSYCLLFTESKSEQTLKRLAAMEKIFIGAELAELDLKLRGPGELYGTLQHGIPKLKAASFSDFDLIQTTKREAEKILPHIDQFPRLLEKLNRITAKEISPD